MSVPAVQRPAAAKGEAAASDEPRSPLRTRIFRALSTIALICVLIIAALMLVPTVLGYQRYVLVSGSMTPAIPTGSVVYDRAVPVEELEVGDVITFVPPPQFEIKTPVTHRIVDISSAEPGHPVGERVYRTKGDANASPDPWQMTLDRPTQARVEHHIEKLGYVYLALSNRWVQLFALALPALVIMVVVLVALWREAGDAVMREEAAA